MSRASVPGVPPLEPADLIGRALADRYRITKLLAEGGMGSVFVGVDERSGDEVAIKVVRSELAHSDEALARFHREARAVVTLDSPYIVAAHDTGTVEGMPYLVMERLRGRGLDELQAQGELTARRAVGIVLELLEGLGHAHAAGIIHRDLKPSNVWITDDDHVKILDFGVAKMHGAAQVAGDETGKLTGSGAVLGSPAYMSPEQLVSSKEADERADLWSVGVVLYELVTGSMLFQAETVGGIFANVIRMRIPPLREVAPSASPELERVVARCLERDPLQRFSSARALANELEAVLETDKCGDASSTSEGAVVGAVRISVGTNAIADDSLGGSPTIALPGPTTKRSPDGRSSYRWLGGVMLAAILFLVIALFGARGSNLSSSSEPASTTAAGDEPSADDSSADEPSADDSSADDSSAEEPSADDSSADEPSADDGVPSAPSSRSARAEPPSSVAPPEPSATPASPVALPPPAAAKVPPEDDLWETSRH